LVKKGKPFIPVNSRPAAFYSVAGPAIHNPRAGSEVFGRPDICEKVAKHGIMGATLDVAPDTEIPRRHFTMTTKEFRDACLKQATWYIHWELWQAAHELGLTRRETTLGYSLDLKLPDGGEITVFQGVVNGLRLPLWHMWPHGVDTDITDEYREYVNAIVPLTDAEKEPSGEFPADFDATKADVLRMVLGQVVHRIRQETAVEKELVDS
jgi:hypothetical protein